MIGFDFIQINSETFHQKRHRNSFDESYFLGMHKDPWHNIHETIKRLRIRYVAVTGVALKSLKVSFDASA